MDDESGESMYQCNSKNWVSPNWRHQCIRLTEGSRELIPETRESILEVTIF